MIADSSIEAAISASCTPVLPDAYMAATKLPADVPVTKSGFKDELVFVLKSINDYLIAFFRGQVIVALCDGVLYTIGFFIFGLPYAFQGQTGLDEIKGGSPYGASTITGGDGSRQPSAIELEAARYQGRHVAEIAAKLAK